MAGRRISRATAEVLTGAQGHAQEVISMLASLLELPVDEEPEEEGCGSGDHDDDRRDNPDATRKDAGAPRLMRGLVTREMPQGFERQSDTSVVFVASEPVEDRVGDIVLPEWDLENYRKNPVFLFAHDWYRAPIGRVAQIGLYGGKLVAEVEFDEDDEFAAGIHGKYERGFLSAVSVGFRSRRVVYRGRLGKDDALYSEDGYLLGDNELLEISAVAIPALPSALAQRDTTPLLAGVKAACAADPGFANLLRAEVPGLTDPPPAAGGSTTPVGDSAADWFASFSQEYSNAR